MRGRHCWGKKDLADLSWSTVPDCRLPEECVKQTLRGLVWEKEFWGLLGSQQVSVGQMYPRSSSVSAPGLSGWLAGGVRVGRAASSPDPGLFPFAPLPSLGGKGCPPSFLPAPHCSHASEALSSSHSQTAGPALRSLSLLLPGLVWGVARTSVSTCGSLSPASLLEAYSH